MEKHTFKKNIRVLLLEDDLEVVSKIAEELVHVERVLQQGGIDISLVVLSEYTMVEQYINALDIHQYYIVLLDRDCKAGGSFHALDFNKFDKNNIVSISSFPEWNEAAQRKGVKRVILKNLDNLDEFVSKVGEDVREILQLPIKAAVSSPDDPLLPQAIKIVQSSGKASATLIQRNLRIGYARSVRLLDLMEEAGIIGPAIGNQPRDVL